MSQNVEFPEEPPGTMVAWHSDAQALCRAAFHALALRLLSDAAQADAALDEGGVVVAQCRITLDYDAALDQAELCCALLDVPVTEPLMRVMLAHDFDAGSGQVVFGLDRGADQPEARLRIPLAQIENAPGQVLTDAAAWVLEAVQDVLGEPLTLLQALQPWRSLEPTGSDESDAQVEAAAGLIAFMHEAFLSQRAALAALLPASGDPHAPQCFTADDVAVAMRFNPVSLAVGFYADLGLPPGDAVPVLRDLLARNTQPPYPAPARFRLHPRSGRLLASVEFPLGALAADGSTCRDIVLSLAGIAQPLRNRQ